MLLSRFPALSLTLLAALVTSSCSRAREAAHAETLARAAKLEQEGQFHDATRAYGELLATGLPPAERADVQYRLARCRIAGNDLNGALDLLEELTEEDVKNFQLDLGPLYLELGDAYIAKGEKKRAQIAWQRGRGVSPGRMVEFNKRIEDNLLPPDPPPTPSGG
jgi:tetratricopeptide (TPR) repeat protein